MEDLDSTYGALADPTRRAILARLALGEATVGEIARPFPISGPAISRHLKLLEEADLIARTRRGQQLVCRLNPKGFRGAQEWLDHMRAFWDGAFDRLDTHLKRNPHTPKDNTMTTAIDRPVLEIKRLFDAPPERLFDAWLNREEWQAWIGPEGCRCDVPLLEPRVGGRYELNMHLGDGREIPVAGVFKILERPRRFAMTWKWALAGEDETLVTVSLRPVKDGTELTLRHEGLLTAEDRDGHRRGWNSTLDKLTLYVKGQLK